MNRKTEQRLWLMMLITAVVTPGPVNGQEGKPPARVEAGKYVTETGMLLSRSAPGKPWQVVAKDDAVYSNDVLVALPGAAIVSKNGAVRVDLLADLDRSSPFPVLESAIKLHAGEKSDLEFTLDRGHIEVSNRNREGLVQVRIRFHHEIWDLKLLKPDTHVAIELYGHWPAGEFFNPQTPPAKDEAPVAALAVVVRKGEAELDHGIHRHAMRAPPGPALFLWNSLDEEDSGPRKLQKVPVWADPKAKLSAGARQMQAVINLFQKRLAKGSVRQAVREALQSGDQNFRRLGVVAMGAFDDVPGLIAALNDSKHPDIRDEAILVLRHWIGRCRGQDRIVYDILVKQKGFSPVHAEILLHGLHSFGASDLARPETYEALIAYLKHDKLAIRELANWQLKQLVPKGAGIKYDAAGARSNWDSAYKKWKELIPDGNLPKCEEN